MKIFKMIREFFLERSGSSKMMKNLIFHFKLGSLTLSELFYPFPFELSNTEANNTDFRTGKPVNMASDWNGHVMSSANDHHHHNLFITLRVNLKKIT